MNEDLKTCLGKIASYNIGDIGWTEENINACMHGTRVTGSAGIGIYLSFNIVKIPFKTSKTVRFQIRALA